MSVAIVGMAIGVILILTTALIFWKQKAFPAGGIVTSIIGLALIGMSEWSHFELGIAGASLKATREEIQQIAKATIEVAIQAEKAAEAVEITKQEVERVVKLLDDQNVVSSASIQPIRSRLLNAPTVDRAKLSSAKTNLDNVIRR